MFRGPRCRLFDSAVLGSLSGFAEEGVDDLELFWGEDFAGAGVAGGLEGGHEWFVGMDFVGEAFARTLLTFGDVA